MKKTLALLLLLAGLSVEAQAKDLVWNGSPGRMTWDLNDWNWFDYYTPGLTCRFEQGAYVHFGDTGSGVVTLDGEFSTRRVYMDNKAGHDYTFTGVGKLVGVGDELALQKEGDGTLTITTANTFSSISIIRGTVVVGNEMALGSGRIRMYNYGGGTPTLDLGKYSISNSVVVDNSYARIGNGTLSGDLTLQKTSHLTLLDDTDITGNISLGDGASFNLADNTVTGAVTLSGSATIGNGTVEGNLTVADNKSLALLANTTVMGGVSLGAQSSLNLGGNTFHTGGDACNRVSFSGGTTVSSGKLVLGEALSSAFTLNGVTLDLNKHTLSKAVTLVGDNAIGNGTLNTHLNVGEGNTLTLCDNLDGQQNQDDKIILGNNATLDLNNHSISKYCYVRINGDAFIGNGSCYSEVVVEEGKKLTLCGNLWSSGWYMGNIILGDKATLDLGKHTYSGLLSMKGASATIGNGTLERDLSVGDGKTLNLCGDLGGSGTITMSGSATLNIGTHTLSKNVTLNGTSTVKAENTTIKALNTDKEGLLKELSVSEKEIVGTGRAASLADGLYIKSEADLLIESMTLTANNEIHVGEHTITLNQVTIDLSQVKYELVGSDYYFQLQNLINCDLEMDDVVFDASGLSLGTSMQKVVFDFGEDVNIDTATRMRLQLDEEWESMASVAGPGLLVFTKLSPVPEPTTGTLSLLALAGLCARRRRK